ncbi:6574_t:CDS:2 [Entrophospora sp. SA101]|nr:6574_t:CDS:2 [Entrophospora sp. SA101]
MFEAQPTRSFGFPILTDFDQGFILFKAIKNDNGLTFLRSEIEQMDVGRMTLYCLFRALPSQLGSNHLFNMPPFISIHNIAIKDLHIIRYNSRSKPMILKGIIDSYGSDIVAKIGRKERLTHEYNVLKFINESISKADLLPEEALSIHNAIKDIAQFLEEFQLEQNTTVSNGSMTRFFASNNYLDAAYRDEHFSMGIRKYHMEDANRWIDFKNQACNLLIIENIKDPEKLVEMLECFHQHLYIDKVGNWLDEECHH